MSTMAPDTRVRQDRRNAARKVIAARACLFMMSIQVRAIIIMVLCLEFVTFAPILFAPGE